MDYAIKYAKNASNETDTLYQINYIRLKKSTVLPFKVIGFNSTQRTKCYQQIDEPNLVKWNINQNTNAAITEYQGNV